MAEDRIIASFDDPLVQRKLGDYFIEARIGRGGMATVYRAIRDVDEAVVAVKVISSQFVQSEEFLRRFKRESRLMAALDHPHILPVYDFGTIGDVTYLVMRLLHGGALNEHLRRGPLEAQSAVEIIEQVCEALDYAHNQGVIHRDLKPANLLRDRDGVVYLTDFGIAKWKDETIGLTSTGSLVGTPGYMAPEQWRTEPVDVRTDIYALGVMTFEMLTGEMPFTAQTPFSLMYKHLDEPPPLASAHDFSLPPGVDFVLERALAKLPELRYQSAGAFAVSLREAFFGDALDQATLAQTLAEPVDDMMTSALPSAVGTYDSIDRGARTILSRARETARETMGGMAMLAGAVVEYVQRLREQAKYAPGVEEGPYKALESYDIDDNRLFFGREEAIDAMLERAPFARFTVLHAESGAGKTSLIRAGLMPRLLAGGFLPLYVAVRRRPPHEAIKRVLLPDPSKLPGLEGASLRTYLKGVSQTVGPKREIFIFVDQFETFFTDVFTDEQRAEFISEIAECLDDSSLEVRVTLAMRTEYFGLVARFQPAIEQPFEKELLLRRLTRDEAERALVMPAEVQGYSFAEGLVGTILDDLADDSGAVAPPQLQLVGTALVERVPGERRDITSEDYEKAGGAKGVLRSYLERLLERLPAQDRRPARVVIEGLVRADQTRDVRTPSSLRAELEALRVPTSRLEETLSTLRENHVLRLVETDEGAAYELVHDYLALQVQLDPETAARKAAQELLERRVRDYEQYGSLLTREELDVLQAQEDWLRLGNESQALINQSAGVFRRQRRLALVLTVAAVLGLVGILAIGLLAAVRESQNRQDRLEAAQTAEARIATERDAGLVTESRRLANLVLEQIDLDSMAALNLSLEAFDPRERPYVPEAEFALSQSIQRINERVYMPSEQRVLGATWNTDETRVLTWSNDDTARIFDAVTGEELVLMAGQSGDALVAAWSPDEMQVLVGDLNGNLYVYNAESGDLILTIEGAHSASIRGVAWDAAGGRILAWSDRDTSLWDSSGERIAQWAGNEAAWSPNEARVLTIEAVDRLTHLIHVWDAETGELVVDLREHVNRIRGAAWSQDGSQILSWSADATARVWNSVTGEAILVLERVDLLAEDTDATSEDDAETDDKDINIAVWSPDERYIAAGSLDGWVIVWDALSGERLWSLQPDDEDPADGIVDGIVWSADASRFLTYGKPDGLGIWKAEDGTRLMPQVDGFDDSDTIWEAAWSPDETYILTRSKEGWARVWDAVNGDELMRFPGHGGQLTSMAWSTDGTRVLTSGPDGSARIWALLDDGILVGTGEVQRLMGSGGNVLEAYWNADETLVAASYEGGTVRVWDAARGDEVWAETVHTGGVEILLWSPNQTRLLSGGDDGRVIIWDVTTGEQLATMAHQGSVTAAAWDGDSGRVASGSSDGKLRVWDSETGSLIQEWVMGDPNIDVSQVKWNRTGTQVLATNDGAYLWIVDVESGELALEIVVDTATSIAAIWNADETQILVFGTELFGSIARVYDANNGDELFRMDGHGLWVVSASWSPDGTRILTTSHDTTAKIWDAMTGEILMTLEGHEENVTEGVWSSDGSRVLTRSTDGTVRVWDLTDGVEVLLIDGHLLKVNSVVWNADETLILTSSNDGSVRVWRSWPSLDGLLDYAETLVTHPLSAEQREAFFLPPATP